MVIKKKKNGNHLKSNTAFEDNKLDIDIEYFQSSE